MKQQGPPATILRQSVKVGGSIEVLSEAGVGAGTGTFRARSIPARDGDTPEPLFAKLLPPGRRDLARMEFTALSGVTHPHLASVYGMFALSPSESIALSVPRGATLLAQRWASGLALSAHELDDEALARHGAALAGALGALHAAGWVHGDVSPANILVDEAGATLVDLGLATRPGGRAGGGARLYGTLGYLPPEAFHGVREPAGDIFSLAAALVDARARSRSEPASVPAAFRLSKSRREPAERALEGAPEWIRDALLASLDPLPESRPSASELQSALSRGRDELAVAPGTHDRASLLGRLRRPRYQNSAANDGAVTDATRGGSAADALIVVAGPRGSGRRRAAEELALAAAARDACEDETARSIRVFDGVEFPPDASILLLDRPVQPGEAAREALHRAARAARIRDPRALLIACADTPLDGAHNVSTAPLDEDALRDLLVDVFGAAPTQRAVETVASWSGGLAGAVVRGLRQGVGEGLVARLKDLETFAPRVDAAALDGLADELREALERASVRGGELPSPRDAEDLLAELRLRGWVGESANGELRVIRPIVDAVSRAMVPARRRALAVAADPDAWGPYARARLHLARENWNAFERVCRSRTLSPSDLSSLVALLSGRVGVGPRLALADALRAVADYEGALGALSASIMAPPPSLDADTARAFIAAAGVERERGDARAALALLAPIVEQVDGAPTDILADEEWIAVAGRTAIDAGAGRAPLPEPRELLRRSEIARPDAATSSPAFLEIRAIVAMQAGEDAAADEDAELAEAICHRRERWGRAARAASLRATLARRAGDTERARAHGARAFELAERAGERLAGAVYAVNSALRDLDAGQVGEAWTKTREGASELARIGRHDVLAGALLNLASVEMLLNAPDSARRRLDLAATLGGEKGRETLLAHVHSRLGELALRRGKRKEAGERARMLGDLLSLVDASARPLLHLRWLHLRAGLEPLDEIQRAREAFISEDVLGPRGEARRCRTRGETRAPGG